MLVAADHWTGIIYTITAQGEYLRGKANMLPCTIAFALYVLLFAAMLRGSIRGRKRSLYFVTYALPVCVMSLQYVFPELPFYSMAFSLILIGMALTKEYRQRELLVDALNAAERAKTTFLNNMSHDIRTPLTSIVGNTAAILENEDSFSPEQKRRLLEDVNEDAQWLIRMVENLLSITRMSGGQAKIEKDCEAAEEIVGVSVSKFTKRFPAIHVSIEVPDEVLMVPMDATLIRQVIMNLLENAAIHGGNVTQIRVCLSREGTNACFAISDNGVGIPKEKLSTIFNGGLSGVSHNNFDMKKNMGIGLSVCYTIVKAHGGTMTAENLDSGGACFRFYLPLEEGINSEIEG